MEITEFVGARIAEDEAAARAAIRHVEGDERGSGWSTAGGYGHNSASDPVADFIRGWSPERVLAECSAKRQVLHGADDDTARALARPWVAHPDFDSAWLE